MNLAQRLSKLSTEQRKLFLLKLEQQGIDISQIPFSKISKRITVEDLSPYMTKKEKNISHPIEPTEQKEYYPLSASQNRMYILNLFIQYNMLLAYQVEGNLDKNRVQQVFQKLVKRHESLRTSFELMAGEPVQKVHDHVPFEIEYHDLTNNGIEIEVNSIISQCFREFDLSVPPLLRVGLIQLSPGRHLFLVNIHHIISDGVSMGILAREFARLYRGEELAEPKIRVRDFSIWQNQLSSTEEYKKKEAYWLDLFSGELPVLDMPIDYPRPPVQDFSGSRVHFSIEGKTFQALKTLALKHNTSMYMVLLAVYYTLLFRYTGQEDIVIGTITAGRERWELEAIIGVFINAIAMRNFPEKSKTFAGFLRELKQNTLIAFENQSYPFGDLLEKVVKKKDPSRNPLFDVMLIFQSVDMRSRRELEVLRLALDRYEYESNHHSQQDMTLWAAVQGERIRMDLEYCTALFKPATIERFAVHFMTLLKEAAANPELKLSELKMYSEKEKRQEEYWLGEFSGPLPLLDLPMDYERPALQRFEGDNIYFKISSQEILTLKKYAREEDTTMFMVVLTLFYVFLAKISGQEDIIIGTPVAGQRYSEFSNIVVDFINTLSLRNYPKKDKSFEQFLGEVKTRTREAFKNQDYQFDDLVKKAQVFRDSSRNPILSVLYSFASIEETGEQREQHLKKHEYQDCQAIPDLILTVKKKNHNQELYFNFEYCTNLFKRETIKGFITYFKEISSAVVKNKRVLLKEIKISLGLEKARLEIPQIEFGF
jgi:non-ribosomal peptide synthetase component F